MLFLNNLTKKEKIILAAAVSNFGLDVDDETICSLRDIGIIKAVIEEYQKRGIGARKLKLLTYITDKIV